MRPKTLISLTCLVLAVFFLTSGSWMKNDPSEQERQKIIYVYKTTMGEIEFWQSISDGIRAGAEEYGFEYSILGAREEWDIEGNIEAVRRAISLRPDVIVLAAADYELLAPVAQKVVEEGILLLTLDSDVGGGISRCYIGTDNFLVGVQMAEELQKHIPLYGRVAIVGHVKSSHTALERVRGASHILDPEQSGLLLPPVYCNNQVITAREQTRALLQEHPDIAGFIATNELSAIGVAEGLVELGLQDEVAVITCDNASRQISYLEQGVIDATVIQKPFSMGYFSVKIADSLLNKRGDAEIGTEFFTDTEMITVENYFTPENQKILFPL